MSSGSDTAVSFYILEIWVLLALVSRCILTARFIQLMETWSNSVPSGDLRKPWTDEGHVIKIPNSFGEEVGLELKGMTDVPTECTRNFSVDFVWKPTSFDRMLTSLKV